MNVLPEIPLALALYGTHAKLWRVWRHGEPIDRLALADELAMYLGALHRRGMRDQAAALSAYCARLARGPLTDADLPAIAESLVGVLFACAERLLWQEKETRETGETRETRERGET